MQAEDTFPLHGATVVVLAGVEVGRALLLDVRDPFPASLQPFEMGARMKSAQPCTAQAFREYQASQVLAWTAEDRVLLAPLLGQAQQLLARWAALPLPAQVVLVKTSGREETGGVTTPVAYCRGLAGVFVSSANLDAPGALLRLLLHELWHIVSRNASPSVVDRVYAAFGASGG